MKERMDNWIRTKERKKKKERKKESKKERKMKLGENSKYAWIKVLFQKRTSTKSSWDKNIYWTTSFPNICFAPKTIYSLLFRMDVCVLLTF